MSKTAVVITKKSDFKGMEGETAQRACRRLLSEGGETDMDIFVMEENVPLGSGDFQRSDSEVIVFISGTVFITGEGIEALSRIISERAEFLIIGPVSNDSRKERQRCVPPFFYQTLSVFRWAAEEVLKEFRDEVIRVDELDEFCFAMKRETLESLPGNPMAADLPLIMKERGLRSGVARGVYAHRYGDCYESGRDDLLAHVPLSAQRVLDIGSARGLFGELLKKRQRCLVTGVDSDRESLSVARNRLDRTIEGNIEEVIDKGMLEIYDCIVCGDVLEHLNNPWKVVKGLRDHLAKGGLFVASMPNIMNWAIIFEQLAGRWDYVPFSILSGTHIRFFTPKTCRELFEDSGFSIKDLSLQKFEIPLQGEEFITGLKRSMKGINEEELRASEILVIAEK